MKRGCYFLLSLLLGLSVVIPRGRAQSVEVQQLLLNATKLSQFKQLLKDLQTSYSILNTGYAKIKGIASGNFSLHQVFLDGLLMVNPALANYRRVADIIRDEKLIIKGYKSAFTYFKKSGRLTPMALDYLERVYSNLMRKSLQNLDALATVLTAGELNMNDDERLTEINRLYRDTHQMLQFLNGFNQKVGALVAQIGGRSIEMRQLKKLNGLR